MPSPSARPRRKPAERQRRATPVESGLPDPRPVTGYDVSVEEIGGSTRVTVTLEAPCVIRAPKWFFVSYSDGEKLAAGIGVGVGNSVIQFDVAGGLDPKYTFIEVPYQDMQVQNFLGGFVAPGAKWFRAPS